MKKIILLILAQVACASFYAQTAKELNSAGYNLYKEGKYEEALDYFKRSFEADPDYHYPHYNYACTIGILVGANYCDWFYQLDNLFYHLEKTIELKPEYREKIKTDPDLEAVRHYYKYKVLTGLNPEKTEDVIQILTTVEWKGPEGPGVYGNLSGIKFGQNGSLSFWELEFSDYNPEIKSYVGTYTVNGPFIYIHFNTPYGAKNDYTVILEQGILNMEGSYRFTDYAGGCGV